jgi:hypothetical protein
MEEKEEEEVLIIQECNISKAAQDRESLERVWKMESQVT